MVKKTAAELKGIDEIRQLNKKKIDVERKKEEEELKRKKDEEEALKKAEEEKAKAIDEDNVTKKLHSIMNGIDGDENIMEISGNEDNNKDEQSPAKKQGGSSKTSTRRVSNKPHKVLSPQENQPQTEAAPSTLKTTKFINNYIHPHRKIVLELAITLTKEYTFDKFAKALASLLSNAQIVNPKFVLNPIKSYSKDKDITTNADISTNMTKLGIHVQISGNGYTFLKKQQIGDKEKQRKKFLKKRVEIRHPTVYFSLIVLSSVDPKKIIKRYAPMNGHAMVEQE